MEIDVLEKSMVSWVITLTVKKIIKNKVSFILYRMKAEAYDSRYTGERRWRFITLTLTTNLDVEICEFFVCGRKLENLGKLFMYWEII